MKIVAGFWCLVAQLLRDKMRVMPRGGGGRRKEFRRLVLQKWDN
jgi:hypothetical protein